MQLICLLPFLLPSSALINVWSAGTVPSAYFFFFLLMSFPLSGSRSRADSTKVTYSARPALTVFFFCLCCLFFVFVVVASDLRSRLAVTCMLMLVASCCLPDPLNAPLCWYVDMAPSAVGLCPLLRCRRGKTPEQYQRRLSQIIILVKRHSCRTKKEKKKQKTLTFLRRSRRSR